MELQNQMEEHFCCCMKEGEHKEMGTTSKLVLGISNAYSAVPRGALTSDISGRTEDMINA